MNEYMQESIDHLQQAQEALEGIFAEHQGLKRAHRIADLHLEHRHHLKSAESTAALATASVLEDAVKHVRAIAQELERLGLAQ